MCVYTHINAYSLMKTRIHKYQYKETESGYKHEEIGHIENHSKYI